MEYDGIRKFHRTPLNDASACILTFRQTESKMMLIAGNDEGVESLSRGYEAFFFCRWVVNEGEVL